LRWNHTTLLKKPARARFFARLPDRSFRSPCDTNVYRSTFAPTKMYFLENGRRFRQAGRHGAHPESGAIEERSQDEERFQR